ncbi:hypothetical protein D915_005380 [Fasciola hepatica]|uniref:Uncharacterized protein n=1 Tax=Fasciola hepatica TaxID=6192 RepID=A0A4E0RC63_FASHE|nr:hypothetical protein D915_005380 [Fasciola hepatica]
MQGLLETDWLVLIRIWLQLSQTQPKQRHK